MINILYIIIGLVVLIACYYIFVKKDTFINKKLENFNGDDLNIHINNDLNILSSTNEENTVIE